MNKQIALIAVASIVIMLAGSVIMMDETSAANDSNPTDTESLKAAIQNASENDTITLGGSFNLTEQINVEKPLNIDLGGHELNIIATEAAGFYFTASSSISNGKIVDNRTDSPDTNGWRVLIASGPTVTLTVSNLEINQANPDYVGENAPYNYAIRGNDGASITLEAGTTITSPDTATEGSQGVVGVAMVGEEGGTSTSRLIIQPGVTISTYGFAITGNGSSGYGNVDFDINGGTLVSYASLGVYHPQVGNMTVDGNAEIRGTTGIEMRAGSLTVNSGSISGSDEPTVSDSNDSGPSTSGAGIAIAQHTSKMPISVTINGGVISGNTALFEKNVENNDGSDVEKIDIAISGGTFNAIGENSTSLNIGDHTVADLNITGGQYSTEVPKDYFDSEYNLWKNPDGSYQIAVTNPNPSSPGYDDDEDLPPFVPAQPAEDDNTVTIVACAAAAAVAAILAVFLVIDRKP